MRHLALAMLACTAFATPALAEAPAAMPRGAPEAAVDQVDYRGFADLVVELEPYRQNRLLDRDAFFAKAAQDGVLLLDTRSAAAFAAGHVEGAVNLPFSDFTEESLRAIIGEDNQRPILIYCNNNFADDVAPVMAKKAPLALNIPTFINLVGYGYENVWELEGTMLIESVSWVSQESG